MANQSKMKIIGLFSELFNSLKPWPSIIWLQNSLTLEKSILLSNYLENGVCFAVVMGAKRDFFSPTELVYGADSLYSDGKLIWRGDLIHYVKKYRICPSNFDILDIPSKKEGISEENVMNIWQELYNFYLTEACEASEAPDSRF